MNDLLKTTLAADYRPGTNQSGDLARADWRFLLPDLQLDRVVCVGWPRASTLRVLSLFSRAIEVVTSRTGDDVAEILGRHDNVSLRSGFAELRGDADISVIVFSHSSEARSLTRSRDVLVSLLERLARDGSVYAESGRLDAMAAQVGAALRRVAVETDCRSSRFWLTTKAGEVRTAVPHGERRISSYFFDTVLPGISLRNRIISRAGRALSRLGLIDVLIPRHATLVSRQPPQPGGGQLPQYIRSLAAESGVDLSHFHYGMSARGLYNSNKIVFFLFEPGAREPSVVVKATRVPQFNDRLENEWQALRALEQDELVAGGTYPRPLFFGYRGGVVVLGQQAMRGRPFRYATTARADCPVAADAIEWITDLGRKSARAADPRQVSDRLLELFDIFAGIYRLSDTHAQFMRRQIDAVAGVAGQFPVVLGHGDAGVWNVTIDSSGRAQFLDWEASEPCGMPLWDLFYFIHSYGAWVSRKHDGIRNRMEAFEKCFMRAGPLNELMVAATRRYCEQTGLSESFLEVMFYTSWMHRALREATWADDLETAHFANLMRTCIDRRDAPGLTALLGTR